MFSDTNKHLKQIIIFIYVFWSCIWSRYYGIGVILGKE